MDPGPKLELLFSHLTIQTGVEKLGQELAERFRDKNPFLLITLKGGIFFAVDLIRALKIPLTYGFVRPASYYSNMESSLVDLLLDVPDEVSGRETIIIEDIVDTGKTLNVLLERVKSKKAAGITVVALIDKPHCHNGDLQLDHSVFAYTGKDFVVGYGLDFNQDHRQLLNLMVMPRPEENQKTL